MNRFTYTGSRLREISFPLGGIGTGCIGLAGNGRLIDWEIFNKPSKGSVNGFSHFAVKAETVGGEVLDARVLNGDLQPRYSGQLGRGDYTSFGFGPPRESMAGMPHFRDIEFDGRFPVACLRFLDGAFPGSVRMTAFNPLIPGDERASGMPAAFVEIAILNTSDQEIRYTAAATLHNPFPGPSVHRHMRRGQTHLLQLGTKAVKRTDVQYGDLSIAARGDEASFQEFWYRGGWNDNLEVYWRDLTTAGPLKPRAYPPGSGTGGDHATLAVHETVRPGRWWRARFVITWNVPNCRNYWSPDADRSAASAGLRPHWRNWYATQWTHSAQTATVALRNWTNLWRRTKRFRDELFGSTMPADIIDAVSANISILKSPTVMRLEDGTFYGFEGCHPGSGCCEGSCTHVWNYAQALPFLFPSLERSMREADYRHNTRPDGGMPFRLQTPLGVQRSAFRPCADGQFGGVMKVYRDWKISGDTEWLCRIWPDVKASLSFAWGEGNTDRWDPDRTGVLWGRQHHTLDMELFGPNAWLTGFYLGALKAGAEMADALGATAAASEYRALFAKGTAWVDQNLFNGRYYHQRIDLCDRSMLAAYDAPEYWSEEHGEIKYQIGDGCGIDQVLAQWHADLYGLGEILDAGHVRTALESVFEHNFKDPIRDCYNPWRIFCVNDEAGLVMCDWPAGTRKPMIPLTYAQETMHGFEYAAAGAMIRHGLVDEGLRVVAAVRDRYDGEKRNPWNEIECGSNYARSMASYGLMVIWSGFEYDLTRGMLGFRPIGLDRGRFRCIWSVEGAWGTFRMDGSSAELEVVEGRLELREFGVPAANGSDSAARFDPPAVVEPGRPVKVNR